MLQDLPTTTTTRPFDYSSRSCALPSGDVSGQAHSNPEDSLTGTSSAAATVELLDGFSSSGPPPGATIDRHLHALVSRLVGLSAPPPGGRSSYSRPSIWCGTHERRRRPTFVENDGKDNHALFCDERETDLIFLLCAFAATGPSLGVEGRIFFTIEARGRGRFYVDDEHRVPSTLALLLRRPMIA